MGKCKSGLKNLHLLRLCLLGNFSVMYFDTSDFFKKKYVSNEIRNTIRVSKSLDSDRA